MLRIQGATEVCHGLRDEETKARLGKGHPQRHMALEGQVVLE